MKIAVYPGSFDPVTYGHLDIIRRASRMFDKVIVAVMFNSAKTPLFTLDERVKMLRESVKDLNNVEIDSFGGLMIDYCKERDIHIVIRGLRAITDFEYELQIAQTNKELSHNEVDTVFLTTSLEYSYLSSSVVKEIASYNGDITPCVAPFIADSLYEKYGHRKDTTTSDHEDWK
ncbi:pantetheine-phosphate adenylyltransferase [Butyrivibrio sp. DSM 10294]|uniref:pantetheine-phosphate adenylyltransferase n=1 Tax=Butyrivibrio sp. DSM 10294 TaxID=2972457 RepID=UPI00234F83CE|nr:pantetheine-phosphate adenylyltransferase [Butyrivibrio sp. DSM 10294]MDC7295256.1 pantetheine-phosphate adenylyltransferase [Butyrivibrio sp. DSM 10294]